MHKFCACSRSAQYGDQHPQDRHPPSPRRSTPIPRIVTHHPWNGHPTSLGRSPTILRTVSHHLHDDHSPAPRSEQEKVVNPSNLVASRILGWQQDFDQISSTCQHFDHIWMILAIFGLTLFIFRAILAIFGQKVCFKTISTHLNCFQRLFL